MEKIRHNHKTIKNEQIYLSNTILDTHINVLTRATAHAYV